MNMNIEKSGTGIGKSGTGIGKSGTGIIIGGTRRLALLVVVLMVAATQAIAGSNLLITEHEGNVVLSLHAGGDVVVGSAPMIGEYQVFALYQAMTFDDDEAIFKPLVKGSGSGSSGFGDLNDNHGLDVKGSGSGAAGESSCASGPGLMVKGSGSGASGESKGDNGSALMVKGSGSGAASESASGCHLPAGAWGLAEVVVDPAGMHVIIHYSGASSLTEYLVAFFNSTLGDRQVSRRPDFFAAP